MQCIHPSKTDISIQYANYEFTCSSAWCSKQTFKLNWGACLKAHAILKEGISYLMKWDSFLFHYAVTDLLTNFSWCPETHKLTTFARNRSLWTATDYVGYTGTVPIYSVVWSTNIAASGAWCCSSVVIGRTWILRGWDVLADVRRSASRCHAVGKVCDGSMCPTKSDLSDARYVWQNSQICPTRPDVSDQKARYIRQIQICPTE